MITTIQLDKSLKDKLDAIKIHHRETYNDLIERLISNSNPNIYDRESLIATIEVLSNPEEMKEIAEALREEGGTTLEDFRKELGL